MQSLEKNETAGDLRPLCVDLDGTLIKSDTLADLFFALLRTHPLQAWKAFFWFLKGKAVLKSRISSLVSLDAAHLPYNRPLLGFLAQEHSRGRRLLLATGADGRVAEQIAAHLGMFDGILASDGQTNVTGNHKLAGLRARFAESGFDYIGNARADLPLLQHAVEPMLANPRAALLAQARSKNIPITRTFMDRAPRRTAFVRAVRPYQWAKNVLVFVPLLLAHTLRLPLILNTLLAFACFSLCASASYIINDMLDMESDRRHPTKRLRPFAAGDLQASTGTAISALFLVLAFAAAGLWLPVAFSGWLAIYLVTTLAYSLALKKKALVDVIVLSGLYTLRLLAGGAAAQTTVSAWLAAFSAFFFFSLAMVKRFSELENLRTQGRVAAPGRGYRVSDASQLRSFGTASAFAAVVVFALYINGGKAIALYRHPERMWLIVPLLLFWISRIWLLAARQEMNEDPVIFAVTDRTSLLIGLAVALIAVFAAF